MIGGNKELILKTLSKDIDYDKNGKKIVKYDTKEPIKGWLDLVSGDSRYDYKAKIEDSTHVFICDYIELPDIDIEETRAVIDGKNYDLKYIDNPMGMNEQLEIYLKLVGGK